MYCYLYLPASIDAPNMKSFCFFFIAVLLFTTACQQPAIRLAEEVTYLTLQQTDSGKYQTPSLVKAPDGSVYLSYQWQQGDSAALYFASLQNNAWTKPSLIAAGKYWFVNWADYPTMAVADSGRMLASYLVKSDTGKFTYDIHLASSADAGKSWQHAGLLHQDGIHAEHGFVSLLPYQQGFFASWLDGRNATAGHDMPAGHEGHAGAMSLRAATLGYTGKVQQEWELDSRTCDCCQTTAAITHDGPVVMYRDRSEREVRDMSVVKWMNNNWTEPKNVLQQNWIMPGCPVNGPRMAANGQRIAAVLFSSPNDSASVQVVFSADGGINFGKGIRIDEGKTIGRVDIDWINENTAIVSWMDNEKIQMRTVSTAGEMSAVKTVAVTSAKRAGGFPQLCYSNGFVYVAWTDVETQRIKTARIAVHRSYSLQP